MANETVLTHRIRVRMGEKSHPKSSSSSCRLRPVQSEHAIADSIACVARACPHSMAAPRLISTSSQRERSDQQEEDAESTTVKACAQPPEIAPTLVAHGY